MDILKKVIVNIPAYRIIEIIDFFKVVDFFAKEH